ncbi:MAG: hypothetical protein RBS09_03025 [Anaerolineaceae bacterium]|jgi:hypothetical protein|nr:hypothetical protein [Anaerolineaceae bacterium]
MNKKSLSLALFFTLFISGCTYQLPSTDVVPTETVEFLVPVQPIENPTTANTPALPATEETTPPTPEIKSADQEKTNRFTYYFDQHKIEQNCLEFPQMHIDKPIDTGDRFVVSVSEQNNISIAFPEDGTLRPLFAPEFPNGHLLLNNIDFDYPWYTYMVVDSPSETGEWNLHVVNLDEDTNTTITDKGQHNSLSFNTYTSLDSGMLYLSTSTFDAKDILSSQLYAFDLASNNVELLIDNQDPQSFMANVAASNGYIVIENNVPKEPVRGLTLFDISNRTWLELPKNNPASMPDMEFPFIVWKNNESFEQPTSFTIFNIETGISRRVDISGRESQDISISDGFAIAPASTGKNLSINSIMLYPIENESAYAIQIGIDEVLARDAYIENGNVIWSFTILADPSEYSSFLCKLPLQTVMSESSQGIED